jgi:hypothetical protein
MPAKYGVLGRRTSQYGVLRRRFPGKIWCSKEEVPWQNMVF